MEKKLSVEGMTCQNCVKRVKRSLKRMRGFQAWMCAWKVKRPYFPAETVQMLPGSFRQSMILVLAPRRKPKLCPKGTADTGC